MPCGGRAALVKKLMASASTQRSLLSNSYPPFYRFLNVLYPNLPSDVSKFVLSRHPDIVGLPTYLPIETLGILFTSVFDRMRGLNASLLSRPEQQHGRYIRHEGSNSEI